MVFMKSLSARSLRKHPSLIPLLGILGFGVALAGAYTARLAIFSPDVAWNKKNPTPWEPYATKRYKFYASEGNKVVKDPRPKIDW